jgi:hypothetical protein
MNWSSPFPEDKKKKITSTKQLEDDELANYTPPLKKEEIPKMDYSFKKEEPEYTYKSTESEISDKLTYMIQLLEEQRDEKTGQVTEELILYVFLGVFTLFVLDTFVKTGKYSR